MRFVSLLPLLILVTGCAGRSASVPSTVLAAADPSAPETPYTQPAEATGGEKPRTLELEIQTKPAGDGGMEGMDHSQHGGAASGAEDHSKHGGAAGASPTPTARPAASPKPAPSEATVYTCPMHPEIRESKPGTCPKCGMKLVPAEKKKEAEKAAPKASPDATAKPSGHEGHGGTP